MCINYILQKFDTKIMTSVQKTLTQIQLRLEIGKGHRLTHKELAKLARTSERTIAEWMRGATSPMAMTALLHLLSQLSPSDAGEVLARWRQETATNSSSDTSDVLETH
jgi:DNA-binding transcriptional regulator YiaG